MLQYDHSIKIKEKRIFSKDVHSYSSTTKRSFNVSLSSLQQHTACISQLRFHRLWGTFFEMFLCLFERSINVQSDAIQYLHCDWNPFVRFSGHFSNSMCMRRTRANILCRANTRGTIFLCLTRTRKLWSINNEMARLSIVTTSLFLVQNKHFRNKTAK